jgi:hypothetical protein
MDPHLLITIVGTILALIQFVLENRTRQQAERIKILSQKLDEMRKILENGYSDVS